MLIVFTPTYNRAYILPILYESLKRQTCRDFEWLIVDDGSTDDTGKIIESWMKENTDFKIRYYYQENGGKHRAINTGVNIANGDWFFIVDSDDYIKNNSVELILKWISEVHDKKIAAVSGTRVFPNGRIIGGEFHTNDKGYIEAKNCDRKQYGLRGDKAEAYRTDILKEYPFPEFDGEKFISEQIVWNEIAYDGYFIRWYNQPIVVCEYLQDGLTNNYEEKIKNNFKGFTFCQKFEFENGDFIEKIVAVSRFAYYAKKAGIGLKEAGELFQCNSLILVMAYPIYCFWESIKKII